jgi:hypothetical protein
VIVKVACLCPPDGSRHPDGDDVHLHERLSFRSAVTMQKSVISLRSEVDDPSTAEILAVLTEAYIVYGVSAWTLQDAKGKAIPVNRSTITEHLLSNLGAALEVADAADDLYQEAVLLPLVARGSRSSVTTPTSESTSPPTSSPAEPPRPLKRSSTSTSRTDATATTSSLPAGDSSSSQSSASAA